MTKVPEKIKQRLEYLRGEIQAERISYGEVAELQDLAPHIDSGDVELLQWAGVPEFPEDECLHPKSYHKDDAEWCTSCDELLS
jgi:hypothetical protein